jgi:hypothetical protein
LPICSVALTFANVPQLMPGDLPALNAMRQKIPAVLPKAGHFYCDLHAMCYHVGRYSSLQLREICQVLNFKCLEQNSASSKITRRDFMRASALGAATTAGSTVINGTPFLPP